MIYQHKSLAAGGWDKLSLVEQMANIGSEVERALSWRSKKNEDYARRALERALELIDLSLGCHKSYARLKEFARMREALVDDFFGTNQWMTSEASWRKYFSPFFFASRRYC